MELLLRQEVRLGHIQTRHRVVELRGETRYLHATGVPMDRGQGTGDTGRTQGGPTRGRLYITNH